ncbi:hypothetical protein NDU88_002061 [Pleurodeles waltl]|uniref:Uncharacterized protein n=1 Tax=Pleurodeles waltl TaxID=8319 RepID=A0AAV7LF16_PLEWA|nr:hypothetical protein NDU88_002061 [Pleurodeles waltl]
MNPLGGELWSIATGAQEETGAGALVLVSPVTVRRRCAAELRRGYASCAAPLIGGEGASLRAAGLVRTCGPASGVLCTARAVETESCRVDRTIGAGPAGPGFSPVKKSGGPQTSRALLAPSSTGVRGTGHPGRALYESDCIVRPRLSYKLRTADGAHRQDTGEDIRLSDKLKGPSR